MENTIITPLESTNQVNYDPKDINLLNSIQINREFGAPEDVAELHILSPSGDILFSEYNYTNYRNRNTVNNSNLYDAIDVEPETDLEQYGFTYGKFNIIYNFQKLLFNSDSNKRFYIKEISGDRTEIKISRNDISYQELSQLYLKYLTQKASRNYYYDFILNVGDNINYIGVNIALDNNTDEPSLYIKLYEPLSNTLGVKDTLWLAETISDSYSFEIKKELLITNTEDVEFLRGPNIDLELNNSINITTPYYNLNTLIDSGSMSSYQKLMSVLEENSIEINIDYNNFNNFVHFSSIKERLSNFIFKLSQIQSLQNDLDNLSNITSNPNIVSSSKILIEKKITDLIEKFDGYEYFLYFESGSNSFPKINDQKPYINVSLSSMEAIAWIGSNDDTSSNYGGKLLDASNFDINNRDYIWNNLPTYIKEDPQNSDLELFISMIGQHFDYIWTYIKDITNLKVADNRIDYGISKDIVGEALKSLGINLYTNSRNQEDIYLSLLGINPNGGFLPSTGSLQINNYVTASQYTIPESDITKETYKRIYHNLPYLLKTKGTKRGLRALINCFGIPETILSIKEYGGSDKDNQTINQIENYFTYGINNVLVPWAPLNSRFIETGYNNIVADTIEFRVKLNEEIQSQEQVLISINNNIGANFIKTSNTLGDITFYISSSNGTARSIISNIPLLNDDWWNIKIDRDVIGVRSFQIGNDTTYNLSIKNSDNEGKIGFEKSSSIFINGTTSSSYNHSWNDFDLYSNIIFNNEGVTQEVRLWKGRLEEDTFNIHVLNPNSTVGNSISSSYNDLVFRASLGNEMDINNTSSIHPKSSGLDSIPSFIFNGNTYSTYTSSNEIKSSYDIKQITSPNIGAFTQVDDKIEIIDNINIPGDTLSKDISIQNYIPKNKSTNLSKVDVAISPQDDIDADIINQLGYFNIDNYIGDPRQGKLTNYPDLNKLRDDYFRKYIRKSNIFDLVKLLSYFDNSLFKMIKDFVPARTNLSTGLIIKPHILERNKVARHEPIIEFKDISGSIDTAFIRAGNGLDLILNTSHSESIKYLNGDIDIYNDDNSETFTGEFGGSKITIYNTPKENIVYELNKMSSDEITFDDIKTRYTGRVPVDPTFNNVMDSRTTEKAMTLEYSNNIITPVNFNVVLNSFPKPPNSRQRSGSYDVYEYFDAPVQDSNYTLKRHINPRYRGSKNSAPIPVKSNNGYTPTNQSLIGGISRSPGFINSDISRINGITEQIFNEERENKIGVLDSNTIKFVYFQEITSQSLTLPGRSNVYIKYLIDSQANIIELTQQNKNLFDIQDIFNGKLLDISLDDNQKPSKQKRLDGLKDIYAGGFRFNPILQNLSDELTSHSNLGFTFQYDIQTLNTNQSPIKENLESNSLLINNITLESQPASGAEVGELSLALLTSFNSRLIANVTRNTPYSGEIIQRITGSITIRSTFSSPNNLTSVYYQNNNGTGNSWNLSIGEYPNFSGDPNFPGLNDNVRSVKIPFGVTSTTWGNPNYELFQGTVIGNNTVTNIQNTLVNAGVTSAKLVRTQTTASLSYGQRLNDFGDLPLASLPAGNYGLTGSLATELTYNIEGLIVLPEGNAGGNILLKTVGNNNGFIRGLIQVQHLGNSRIMHSEAASVIPKPIYRIDNPYYYSAPPDYIYITGTIDNGFNSGSSQDKNWYFERGSNGESGSIFNILTGSYDLSRIYYNYIAQNNNITQTFPTFSNKGYEDIMDPFIPKIGDLVRFYNYDKDSFTLDFENEIVKIIPPISNPSSGSYNNRLIIELRKEIPNQACLDYPSSGSLGKRIQNFIMLSKVADETNIVINGIKNEGQTSSGIAITDDITDEIKQQAGNIVKQLKSQNLI